MGTSQLMVKSKQQQSICNQKMLLRLMNSNGTAQILTKTRDSNKHSFMPFPLRAFVSVV